MQDRKSTPSDVSLRSINITDLIVAGAFNSSIKNVASTGEFRTPHLYGGKTPKCHETAEELNNRLSKQINLLAKIAAASHKQANYTDGKMSSDKENNITRLVTNEFFFYTEKPLSLKKFEALLNKISDMAKTQPENLHLILASFAVQSDNNLMNVVVYIECGNTPNLQLIVKNNSSDIDPVYPPLMNASADQNNISRFKLNINGNEYRFSFNSTFESKTAGGIRSYVCMDICFDHLYGTAKQYLRTDIRNQNNKSPYYCSHIVVSNCVGLRKMHCVDSATYADALQAHRELQSPTFPSKVLTQNEFGTNATIFTLPPKMCGFLPKSLTELNEKIKQYSELAIVEIKKLSEQDMDEFLFEANVILRGINNEILILTELSQGLSADELLLLNINELVIIQRVLGNKINALNAFEEELKKRKANPLRRTAASSSTLFKQAPPPARSSSCPTARL